MGEKVSFGSTDYTGELYGIIYVIHVLIDRKSDITVDGTKYKQRRLQNYLLLNVANTMTDLGTTAKPWPATVDVIEQELQNWVDVGYDAQMELFGASVTFMVAFQNYR